MPLPTSSLRRAPLALGPALLALLLLLTGARAESPRPPAANAAAVLPQGGPDTLFIPFDDSGVELDGFCREYVNAVEVQYAGPAASQGTISLRHNSKYLYVCVRALGGSDINRYFSIYLDTDNGREEFAETDDYSLRIEVTSARLNAQVGTGRGGYGPGALPGGFEAAAVAADGDRNFFDSVEYRIPLPLFYTCQQPFGLAVFQHWVNTVGDDYGWPSVRSFDQPQTWREAALLDTGCTPRQIQVCHVVGSECIPAPDATLFRLPGAGAPSRLPLDANGFVTLPDSVLDGDRLWAIVPVAAEVQRTRYDTSEVIAVDANAFPNGLLQVPAGPRRPLLVQDLDVSAQWLVTGDPAYQAELAQRLRLGSNYFYDYTAGQFMLGDITVYQMGERWDESDLHVYLSNVNRPNSVVGGIVATTTPDISPTVTISYTPGFFAMGKEWNRYMAPPGQTVTVGGLPVEPAALAGDWPMALAHELGHYLLFLFDTYVDAAGDESQALGEQCYGSAMGQVYDPLNHSFVWDEAHWAADCGKTLAHATTAGRTEWETIRGWYDWVVPPTGPQPQAPEPPLVPPVSLTTVTFIAPAEPMTQPLAASQLFDLLYVDGETASHEARAFTFRGDRIFDQGKPPAGLTQVELTDARIDDRLCIYDLNDHGEGELTPRYQFGCETIVVGDDELAMTKNEAWRPLVEASQLDTTHVAISVVQELTDPAATIQLRIYPEVDDAYPPVTMNRNGALHTFTVDFGAMGDVVLPFFMQFWVEEALPNPLTPRETIADRGTGGGGAFGAAWHGGVLVVSSDGHASFTPAAGLQLQPGESIAWQSMPGTPPLPADKQIVGQSYRLDAYPASLVEAGTVAIEFQIADAGAELVAAGVEMPALHFWNGARWSELPTTVQRPAGREDGLQVASADSAGVGVYAVLAEQPERQVWLPLVRQP